MHALRIGVLTSVNYGDGQTQGYTFDPMGNRLTKTDNVTGSETYGYNAANMLTSRNGNAYTSDNNGNTLTGGGRTNTWDGQNRLTQCVTATDSSGFVYGRDGLRRRATVNGTTTDFIIDGQYVVRERRGGVNHATYLHGARGAEYRRDDSTSIVRWYLHDGLGSVLGEVDQNGNVTASRKYDVYGTVRSWTGTATSTHAFGGNVGHPSEGWTGLIYMRARYYDPTTGRFVSEDPSGDGANWFAYADGNPVNKVDVDGQMASFALGGGLSSGFSGSYNGFSVGVLMGGLAGIFAAIACMQLAQSHALNGVFFAKKKDIQDFEHAISGLGLSRGERRQLHDLITGEGYTLEEIREIAEAIVAGRGNKQPEEDDDE